MSLRVQTVQWVGNGSGSDRLIATKFALNVGHTLVIVFPQSTVNANNSARSVLWRNSAASPAGTRDPYDPSNHKSSTGGVVALQSGGFTVNNDGGFSPVINANETNFTYTAVVLNDPTGEEMVCGQFAGNGTTGGQTQTINTGLSGLSDVWLVGGAGGSIGTGTAYRSNLFSGNTSMPLGNGGQLTDQITGFSGGDFTVKFVAVSGSINASNGTFGGGGLYEWVAFNLSEGNSKMQHFYQNGAASPITINFSGFYDAIQMVVARKATANNSPDWRGPDQTGTASISWSGPGTANASGGIEAKTATAINLGTDVAPNGSPGAGLVFPGIAGIPPEFTSIDPTEGSAAGGTSVTITGDHFIDGAIVNFDGIAATDVVVVSATEITCTTPAHVAGLSDITVTNPDFLLITATDAFEFIGSVDSVTPNHGPLTGGTSVTISGSGFIDGSTVTFGGAPATDVVVVDQATITCVTPAHALGSVDVEVVEP